MIRTCDHRHPEPAVQRSIFHTQSEHRSFPSTWCRACVWICCSQYDRHQLGVECHVPGLHRGCLKLRGAASLPAARRRSAFCIENRPSNHREARHACRWRTVGRLFLPRSVAAPEVFRCGMGRGLNRHRRFPLGLNPYSSGAEMQNSTCSHSCTRMSCSFAWKQQHDIICYEGSAAVVVAACRGRCRWLGLCRRLRRLHSSMLGCADGKAKVEVSAKQTGSTFVMYTRGKDLAPHGPCASKRQGPDNHRNTAKFLSPMPTMSPSGLWQDSKQIDSEEHMAVAASYCAVFFRGCVRMKWADECLRLVAQDSPEALENQRV